MLFKKSILTFFTDSFRHLSPSDLGKIGAISESRKVSRRSKLAWQTYTLRAKLMFTKFFLFAVAPVPPQSLLTPRQEIKLVDTKKSNSLTRKFLQSYVRDHSSEGGEVTVGRQVASKTPPISFDYDLEQIPKSPATGSVVVSMSETRSVTALQTEETDDTESKAEGTRESYVFNNVESVAPRERTVSVDWGGERIAGSDDRSGASSRETGSSHSQPSVVSDSEDVKFQSKVATKDIFGDNETTVKKKGKDEKSSKSKNLSLAQFIQQNQPRPTTKVEKPEEIQTKQVMIEYPEEPQKTSLTQDLVDHKPSEKPKEGILDLESQKKFKWNSRMASKNVIGCNGKADAKDCSSLVLEVPESISFVKIIKGGEEYTLEL